MLALLLSGTALGDHRAEELVEVLPRDAIPAVREPTFAAVDYLGNEEPVIGLEIEGDARAYPLRILNHHEIINDVVGYVPLAVTFCPLCNSAVAYDRRVGDMVLTFGVSGFLHKSNLVMYDEETESLWIQLTSEAVQGPLHGTQLTRVPVTVVAWGAWKESYPDSRLLDYPSTCNSQPGGGIAIIGGCLYDFDPYEGYRLSDRVFDEYGSNFTDTLLHPKAVVLGVEVNGVAMAYPFENLSRELVINDIVNGLALVATFHDGSTKAFERGGRTFSLGEGRTMVDDEGRLWDRITGEGEAGQLPETPSVMAFWFSWAEFNEGTGVYGFREPPLSDAGSPFGFLVPVLAAAGTLGVVLAFVWLRRRGEGPIQER